MIDLEKISAGVLKDRASVSGDILSSLDEGLSLWLCLIDLFDKCEFSTKSLISENFNSSKDEIFNEIHIALTLAYHKKFRSASIITRSCIELAAYSIYFIDHPADCLLWSNNSRDMSFSSVVQKIFETSYLNCMTSQSFDPKEVEKKRLQLQSSYRTLSECVHGKPGFMSLKSSSLSSKQFSDVFLSSIRALLSLAAMRLDPAKLLVEKIPALERMHDVQRS